MKKLFIFCFLTWVVSISLSVFPQTTETITLTTYYPSPVGIYNRLATGTLGVGDNNNDGIINAADAPDVNDPLSGSRLGDAWFGGGVGIGDTNNDGRVNDNDLARYPAGTTDSAGNDISGQTIPGGLTVAETVGIGTNNPQGELHVAATDSTNGDANLILEGRDPTTTGSSSPTSTGTWDMSATGGTPGSAGTGDFQITNTDTDLSTVPPTTTTTTPFTIEGGADDHSLYVDADGNVGIGTNDPQGPLDIASTTGGLLPPRLTQAELDALVTSGQAVVGMVAYNTDTGQLVVYNGTSWETVGGGLVAQGAASQVAQTGYCSDSYSSFNNQVRGVTINTTGGSVLVLGTYTGNAGPNNWCAGAQLRRDGTEIYQTLDHHSTAHGFTGIQWDSPVIFAIDTPAAGSHTYTLHSQIGSGNVFSSALYAFELQ